MLVFFSDIQFKLIKKFPKNKSQINSFSEKVQAENIYKHLFFFNFFKRRNFFFNQEFKTLNKKKKQNYFQLKRIMFR